MGRLPQLKQAFQGYIGRGYFENIALEYVPGASPSCLFYDIDNNFLYEHLIGRDMNIEELKQFLKEYGFELRRPSLPPPVLTAETTIGNKHYKYYGDSKLYNIDAQKFAAGESHNGQQGRLLTIRCKAEEDKVSEWIRSIHPQGLLLEAWLGCYDGEQEGTWKWLVNGISELLGSTYTNWKYGEPNNADGKENCATIQVGEGWNDVDCDHPANVIVEFGPSQSSECDSSISDVHAQQQQVDL